MGVRTVILGTMHLQDEIQCNDEDHSRKDLGESNKTVNNMTKCSHFMHGYDMVEYDNF